MPRPDGASGFRQRGLRLWAWAERRLDAVFGAACNPLRQLGAVGFLALVLLVASGALLYVVFDTSVAGAYASVQALAHWPLGLGRVLRGLHHYAADLLVLALALHVVREWLHGHERGVRWFHWLTGVPLVLFVFASAIGGFWLVWDELGLYSAQATAEWLDALPLGASSPLARNFLALGAVSDRLFSLFIFVHVGVPLLFLFGLWFHVQRLNHVRIWPAQALGWGLVASLVVLALVQPVLSHAPAALDQVPMALRLDWLLLWLHPLADVGSPALVWAVVLAVLLCLVAAPFLPQPARPAVAVVDPAHCSGCRFCFDDCPYAAIRMVAHSTQRPGHWMAEVDAELCVGCGVCAGACPSSTPFRGGTRLDTGIDMPQRPVDALRQEVRQTLAGLSGPAPVLVFSCAHTAQARHLAAPDVGVVPALLCAGQLPPTLIEYAIDQGAAGVLLGLCPPAGCAFRLGERWTLARLAGQRHPRLRASVPGTRLALVAAAKGDTARLERALQGLRARVQALPMELVL